MLDRERQLDILIDALCRYYNELCDVYGVPDAVSRYAKKLRGDVDSMIVGYRAEQEHLEKEQNQEEVVPNERTVIG